MCPILKDLPKQAEICTCWQKYCPAVWGLLPITGPACSVQAAFIVLQTNVPTLLTGAASIRYGLVPFCHIPHLGKKQYGRLREQLQAWEPSRWNGMNENPHVTFLSLFLVHTPLSSFQTVLKTDSVIIIRDDISLIPRIGFGYDQIQAAKNGGLKKMVNEFDWIL